MLSLLVILIIFIGLIIINDFLQIEELYYLILGIASSFLLYNFSLIIDNRNFSLIFLYLSVIMLLIGIFLTALQYIKKFSN